jgi:hypothetical protein
VIEYRALGPLSAASDGAPLALGGPKQRMVLAVLLVGANRVVSVDRLVDGVWGERPASISSLGWSVIPVVCGCPVAAPFCAASMAEVSSPASELLSAVAVVASAEPS